MPQFLGNIPWLRKFFNKGANTDVYPALLEPGTYIDAQNMRPRSIDGQTGAMEDAKGEELLWGTQPPNPNYVLIGSDTVNGRVVEFWCSTIGEDPIVRVDGVITAQSPLIPYRFDKPLQIAVAERCAGGLLYPADHNSPPLRWDVQDMLDSLAAGTGKYFGSYNPEENSAQTLFAPDWPRHIGNPNVGSGLAPGQRIYYLRAVYPGGDLTNPGPESNPISIGAVQDVGGLGAELPYPGGRTTGGAADTTSSTAYGTTIEFRIDNTVGYSEYQICCREFIDGQGLNGPGVDRIIKRIPVQDGDFYIYQFTDPVDRNESEIIPPDEVVDQQIYINKPKGVEYADNRLTYANVETLSRNPALEFRESEGRTCFPFTKRVTSIIDGQEVNTGYTDPVNNTYLRGYMRGEKHTFAVALWDGSASRTFGVEITGANNFQFPNRRDIKGAQGQWGNNSALYSDTVFAATVETSIPALRVQNTFEAFEQGTQAKDDGLFVTVVPGVNGGLPYVPLRPINPQDGTISGYNLKPNYGRLPVYDTEATVYVDRGEIWNPRYHAMGLMVNGVLRSSIPSLAKVITIARSAPAQRVIAQGLASYDMRPNEVPGNPAEKSTTSWRWFGRDAFAAITPKWAQFEEQPTRYALQAVSPLGFYNETYGWRRVLTDFGPTADGAALDMLLYAGVQRDNGEVNIGDEALQGVQPGAPGIPPANYVGYGLWRNLNAPSNYWSEGTNNGNTLIPLAPSSGVEQLNSEFNSRLWRLRTDPFIYSPSGNSVGGSRDFQNSVVRLFHQPFYVVNVVDEDARVEDQNINQYIQATHVHVEKAIGVTNTDPLQSFRLVNERLDDVRPRFNNELRYVYVRTPGFAERPWVCVSNTTAINGATVLAEIALNGSYTTSDGTVVYGVYQAFTDAFGDNFVRFGGYGISSPVPPENSRIVVKYDDTAPIEVFGGDTTISPCVHNTYDRWYNDETGSNDTFELGGLPLPYPGFQRSIGYFVPQSTTPATVDSQFRIANQLSLRQLAIMFDAESRVPGHYNLYANNLSESFPRNHYRLNPYAFAAGQTAAQAGFFPQYDADYPNYYTRWGRGGMPVENNLNEPDTYNLSYSKQPNFTIVGVPKNGFTEQTDFCTSLFASLEKNPLAQDIPGIQTFLQSNVKAISEENGEIKYIASLLQGGSRNMYAITNRGVCRILTNKNVLTGADGQEVSTQSISNYWGEEIWIDRYIGAPYEFWQLLARGSMPTGQSYADTLTWPDQRGWYRLAGNTVVPIARDKYLKDLLPVLAALPQTYIPGASGFYNPRYEEVWNSVGGRVYVYNPLLNEWTGQYTYDFDGFSVKANEVLAHRDLQTFTLDQGFTINGTTREAWVDFPVYDNNQAFKEVMRWRAVGEKPDYVEVYDKDGTLICRMDETTGGTGWAKLYDGYEGWINRILATVDPARPLPQGMGFVIRFGYNTFGAKRLSEAAIQTKALK
jgi:hypothetical protein